MRDWWLQTLQHFLDYCPIVGTMVNARRATDQELSRKLLVMLAVPVLTAVPTVLIVYGALVKQETRQEAQIANHEARANADRAEVKERLDKLELELRLTHQKIVEYQLQHAEQDRREFNDLRRK